jgi:hypothetical protein
MLNYAKSHNQMHQPMKQYHMCGGKTPPNIPLKISRQQHSLLAGKVPKFLTAHQSVLITKYFWIDAVCTYSDR